jgi:NADPH:quinone reductase-like Zn-dependent oxidoreductase
MTSGRKVIAGPAAERAEDLRLLAKLAEEGELRPVIDSVFSFERIADAHRVVDSGRKRGSVVVTVRDE